MINLDPSLLDQDKIRKEKRKYYLRIFALPIALLIAVSLFFLSSWIYNLIFLISYSRNNFPIAHDVAEPRFLMNVLEPYIADYNQGVASLRMGEFDKAEESFKKSLELNPPESRSCKIIENLSLSIEKQADSLRALGRYSDAIEKYSYAENILYSYGCASKDNSEGKSYNSDIAKDRIVNSRNDAIDGMNHSHDEGDSTGDDAREKEMTDHDIEENQNNRLVPNTAPGLRSDTLPKKGVEKRCNPKNNQICW